MAPSTGKVDGKVLQKLIVHASDRQPASRDAFPLQVRGYFAVAKGMVSARLGLQEVLPRHAAQEHSTEFSHRSS